MPQTPGEKPSHHAQDRIDEFLRARGLDPDETADPDDTADPEPVDRERADPEPADDAEHEDPGAGDDA